MDILVFRPYLEAAAMGLGVGLERDWSNRHGEQQAAGSRTFAVLALAGAVAAGIDIAVVAAGAVAVTGLLIVGYLRTAQADRGVTTEAAALATYLLGALCRSDAEVAIGLAVTMAVLLSAKGPIHRFAREIVTASELEDALRFFVVAFVVLPLLPDRKVGPYGVLNPAKIWLLVVVLTGIGWAGYIATRALGAQRGLLVTGFAGGFISATATTASLGHLASQEPLHTEPAVGGAVLASAATLVQLAFITAVANTALLAKLAPAICIGLAAFAVETVVIYRRGRNEAIGASDAKIGRSRPFSFWPALVIAGLLTVVTLAAKWGTELLGPSGAVIAAAIGGLADAHAPVLAVASLVSTGSLSVATAAAAAGVALATNTISKLIVAFGAGGRHFASQYAMRMAPPVGALAVTMVLSLT
jgi:uncharacterized membrane protein (DUF4010 family)